MEPKITTETEWRAALSLRVKKWNRMQFRRGCKPTIEELGPMPKPPEKVVEYYSYYFREGYDY